jgi:hypothetical protein
VVVSLNTKRASPVRAVKAHCEAVPVSIRDSVRTLPSCARCVRRSLLELPCYRERADHSFHVLKRSGTTEADALRDLGANCFAVGRVTA